MIGMTTENAETTLELSIQGMHCAACAARLEKVLNRLPQVTAQVHFATAQAQLRGAVNLDASRYCRTPLFGDEDRPHGVGCLENVLLENFNVRAAAGAGSFIDLETNCRGLTVRQFAADGKPPLGLLWSHVPVPAVEGSE